MYNKFKDKIKENKYLILILLIAFIVRLYFFFFTMNQSLWWDESEYMLLIKNFALGTNYSTLYRPIAFSLLLSPLYKLFPGEIVPRIAILLFSVFLVYGFYLCGKIVYNKEVGLLSALFASVYVSLLYLSTKIMVDMPSFVFYIFAVYFFYNYLLNDKPKYLYITAALISIGSLFRITTMLFFLVIIIYLFIYNKRKLISKELWISGLLFLIIFMPYIIWGYVAHNNFIVSASVNQVIVIENSFISTSFSNMVNYCSDVVYSLFFIELNYTIVMLLLIFIGFVFMFIAKDNKHFYIILTIIIPFLSFSFLVNHFENRYIINSLLGIVLLLSYFVTYIKNKNFIPFGVLFMFVTIIFFIQLNASNVLIKQEYNNFDDIKTSAFWIKNNSLNNINIISSNPYQLTYYSGIQIYPIPKEKNGLDIMLHNVTYIILSDYETKYTPSWVHDYLINYSLKETIGEIKIYVKK